MLDPFTGTFVGSESAAAKEVAANQKIAFTSASTSTTGDLSRLLTEGLPIGNGRIGGLLGGGAASEIVALNDISL